MAGIRVGSAVGAVALAAALAVTVAAPMTPDGGAPPGSPPTVVSGLGSEDARYAMPLDGEVLVPFDDPDAPWGAGHRGVDIAGEVGAVVLAAADGTVAFVGVVVDRPVISIDHPDGIRTTYEPVAATVAVGDVVAGGQPIGTLVVQGSHCGPTACLHWGARVADDYIDPLTLLSEAVIRLYPTSSRISAPDPQRRRGRASAGSRRAPSPTPS